MWVLPQRDEVGRGEPPSTAADKLRVVSVGLSCVRSRSSNGQHLQNGTSSRFVCGVH